MSVDLALGQPELGRVVRRLHRALTCAQDLVPLIDSAKQLGDRYAASLERQPCHGNSPDGTGTLGNRQALDVAVDDHCRQRLIRACIRCCKQDAAVGNAGVCEPLRLTIDNKVAAIEPATQARRGLWGHDGRQLLALGHEGLQPVANRRAGEPRDRQRAPQLVHEDLIGKAGLSSKDFTHDACCAEVDVAGTSHCSTRTEVEVQKTDFGHLSHGMANGRLAVMSGRAAEAV